MRSPLWKPAGRRSRSPLRTSRSWGAPSLRSTGGPPCGCTCCRTRSTPAPRRTCGRSRTRRSRRCSPHLVRASEMALAQRHRIPADWESFATLAEQEDWSDGLPLIPPTEERVAAYLDAAGADPAEVIVDALPPRGAACSTEQL